VRALAEAGEPWAEQKLRSGSVGRVGGWPGARSFNVEIVIALSTVVVRAAGIAARGHKFARGRRSEGSRELGSAPPGREDVGLTPRPSAIIGGWLQSWKPP
jgi:hypothetical protein